MLYLPHLLPLPQVIIWIYFSVWEEGAMQCLGPLGESQAWATGSVHYMVNNRCVKKRDLSHPSIWGGRRYEMHRYLMKEGALVVGQ